MPNARTTPSLGFALSIAGLAVIGLVSEARADRCRHLEMQLMQLQVGGVSAGEAGRAGMLHNRLAREGCRGGGAAVARVREPRREVRAAIIGYAPRHAYSVDSSPASRVVVRRQDSRAAPVVRRAGEIPPIYQSREQRRDRQNEPGGIPPGYLPEEIVRVPKPREGTYTTMCVRRCDGYYFPVSFATSRDGFMSDLGACQRRCPAASVDLFVHKTLSEGPREMVSLSGKPYVDLPTAFLHQISYKPSCTCGKPRAPASLQTASLSSPYTPRSSGVTLPEPRPAAGSDPESVANLRGGMSVPDLSASAVPIARTDEGTIRIVGEVEQPSVLVRALPGSDQAAGRPEEDESAVTLTSSL